VARKKVAKVDGDDVDQLRELVDSNGDSNGSEKPTSRRNLLKMAGAALAGAAGVAALKVVPAAAVTGDAVLQGNYNFASVDSPTYLVMGASNANAESGAAFVGRASTGLRGAGYFPTDHTQEIGVFGISKGDSINGTTFGTGTGVAGLSNSGRGTAGASQTGTGVFGMSGTGYDVQLGFPVPGGAVGTGRLAMVGRTDIGAVAPLINPAFVTTTLGTPFFQHELIRGNDSSIWASRFDGSSPTRTRWKRINAVRVDTADGLGGSFKPFRVKDTRLPTGAARKGANTMNVVPVAGLGTGASNIPGDAIAVIGNLTATAYTGTGFLAIMPAGIVQGTGAGQYNPLADPSSLNFITGQGAIANSFVCGLSGGSLQVYVGGHSSHFIVDITGYLQ